MDWIEISEKENVINLISDHQRQHLKRYEPVFVVCCTIAHAFFQKMAQKSPPIFIIFYDTY